MDILGWLALVMLTLFGYSAGAVLGGKVRSCSNASLQSPSLLDTLAVAGLWICAIFTRATLLSPWTAVGVWFISGLALAFLINLLRKQRDPGRPIPQ